MGLTFVRASMGLAAATVLLAGCGSSAAPAVPVAAVPAPTAAAMPDMDPAPVTGKATGPKGCLQVHQESPTGDAACIRTKQICANGSVWWKADIDRLCGPVRPAHIRIVSVPAAEVPGAEYCLVYSGTGPMSPRDAALAQSSPGSNCGTGFVSARTGRAVTGGESSFYATPQTCTPTYPGTRLTYPAVVDWDAPGLTRPRQWGCLSG